MEAKLQGMSQEIEEIQAWMEAVLGEPFQGLFTDELKDGVKLCEFANCIRPKIIPKVGRCTEARGRGGTRRCALLTV